MTGARIFMERKKPTTTADSNRTAMTDISIIVENLCHEALQRTRQGKIVIEVPYRPHRLGKPRGGMIEDFS